MPLSDEKTFLYLQYGVGDIFNMVLATKVT